MVRAQRFGASAAEIRTRIEPKLPAEPNGAGSVGFKRELYSDAGWATQYGETPNPGLDTPTSPTGQPHAEHHVPGQTSVAQRESC